MHPAQTGESLLLAVAGTPFAPGLTASNVVPFKNLSVVVPSDMPKSNHAIAEISLQYRVKARIINEKLTQNKLCKSLGIGVSSLSRWLNGLTAKMNPAYLIQMDEM